MADPEPNPAGQEWLIWLKIVGMLAALGLFGLFIFWLRRSATG